MPLPTWTSGDVTSMPSFTRSGRPSASFVLEGAVGQHVHRVARQLADQLVAHLRCAAHDVRGGDFVRRPAAEERERVLRLVPQELEDLAHAGVSTVREAEDHRPPDEDGAGAERERRDDVAPAADATVDVAPRPDRRRRRRPREARAGSRSRRRAGGLRGSRRRRAAAPCSHARTASSAVTRPLTTTGTFQRSRSSVT